MEVWCNKVAVVTGGNCGIGFSAVKLLLDLNMQVIAVDKNLNNLESLKKDDKSIENGISQRLHPLKVDLRQEKEVKKVFQWADNNLGGLDVLVNNAGVGGVSKLLESDPEEWKNMLDVNVVAFGLCIVEAVTLMKKCATKNGIIINITSNLAHFVPRYAPFHFYSATKHAARALAEGFRQELLSVDEPIRITSISPGFVKTDIFKSSLGKDVDKYFVDNFPSINPEDVAASIKYILSTPPHVTINEIGIRPTGSEN
ncbi:hypothetical protein O3M35_000256 [Rhynocoris fuscipes]|uniref:Farnesol dehydrogenase-like n=1 Tax=Rhynocoris fuscipes TaxID=488301 RepID=A0AAW1DMS9_9HEMI